MDFDGYSFTRYLAAKRTVDDRALNRQVWQTLVENLPASGPDRPLRVLEIGCGIGTMLARMLDWGLLEHAEYTGIDSSAENIAAARDYLAVWGRDHGYAVGKAVPERRLPGQQRPQGPAPDPDANILSAPSSAQARPERSRRDRPPRPAQNTVEVTADGVSFAPGARLPIGGQGRKVIVELQAADLFDFIPRQAGRYTWDLLVAHAFLDLVDIHSALPQIFRLSHPGTLFYFTLVFDGVTLLEPRLEQDFDALVERLYHRTMDERIIDGKLSGDSRSGRHLFGHLQTAGARLLAAGASDWVVFPGHQGYLADEAYFLHFILRTMESALSGHPELDGSHFKRWIAARHAQIERAELLYIAHQLDFLGWRVK